MNTQKQGPCLRPLWVGTNPYHFGFSGFCFAFFFLSVSPQCSIWGFSEEFVSLLKKTQNLPNLESMTSKTRGQDVRTKQFSSTSWSECSRGGVTGNGRKRLHPRGAWRMQGSSGEAPVHPHGCSSQGMIPDVVEGLLLPSSAWTPKGSSFSSRGSSWDERRRHW